MVRRLSLRLAARLSYKTYRSNVESVRYASWTSAAAVPANRVQIYTSSSHDPFVNLSIEHYLFQNSPPGSKVLFQYVNRPSVIIGRNQNPWLEVNLPLLREGRRIIGQPDKIDLVRRRSGGGTVWHDEGNVNWSVICDFTEFTRDKHAEMVVLALRKLGIQRARVNERHDIVLDQGQKRVTCDPNDTHRSAFEDDERRPLKVSGSAYKMSGNRALHHGTALLQSPNLPIIGTYLRSEGRNHISAKGVGSVSSPVGNVGVDMAVFQSAVEDAFIDYYGQPMIKSSTNGAVEACGVQKGCQELKSLDWIYEQTPEFTFVERDVDDEVSNSTSEDDARTNFKMTVLKGVVKAVEWRSPRKESQPHAPVEESLRSSMLGRKLHEIKDWESIFRGSMSSLKALEMTKKMQAIFPAVV